MSAPSGVRRGPKTRGLTPATDRVTVNFEARQMQAVRDAAERMGVPVAVYIVEAAIKSAYRDTRE